MTIVLNKKKIRELRTLCANAEKKGALTPAILDIIYKEKWFKLFLPKHYDGLDLSLPDALHHQEMLAYVDGSLGWTITLCAGANLFAGYISHPQAPGIFTGKKVCLGGSGAVSGTAKRVTDGYIINGRWKYATGAKHLTHFTANCVVEENGVTVLNQDGSPAYQSFFFKRSEVTIHQDWNTMGLKATGGHSFSVSNLKVAEKRSFIIDPQHAVLDNPVYQYPFLPFAEATIAVNTLGMTRHFLELATEALRSRNKKIAPHHYNDIAKEITTQQAKIEMLRDSLFRRTSESWNILLSGKKLPGKVVESIDTASRQLVKVCRNAVTVIYPYCGLGATQENSELNRVFRDIFTASQHGLLTFPR